MSQKVLDALTKKFGDRILSTSSHKGDETFSINAKDLIEIMMYLREDEAMTFDFPVFVTCIDRLGLGVDPRFEVCFQFRSTKHGHRIRIKIPCAEDSLKVPSLTPMYPGLVWLERETFDMYGVEFEEHPDLRRIYMYDEFEGHPLRKDYPKDKRQPLVRREWVD